MKKQTFLVGVLILFIAGMLAKVLGAVYRIPLTWILGAEGLGLYQLIFPVFSLLLVLSSSGMPTAISKLIANHLSQNDYISVKKILKISLLLLGSIGLLFGILLSLLSFQIASLQQNPQLSIGYIAIAPSLFLVSILSCFRGYFQGHSLMMPTALSQIIEQAGKLILGLILSATLIDFGVEYGVLGAILGTTLSEVIAVVVMFLYYKYHSKIGYNSSQSQLHNTLHSIKIYKKASEKSKDNALLKKRIPKSINSISNKTVTAPIKTNKQICATLIKTSLPIILASVILPVLNFIESLVVIPLLFNAGFSNTSATMLWGINTGVVNSLINMPITLSLSSAISLVPALASTKNPQKIQQNYTQALTLSMLFCIPVFFGFILLASPIISLLYNDSLGGNTFLSLAITMLISSSIIILLGSALQIQNSTLQSLGKGKISLFNMAISGILKIILFLILVQIPSINIWGSVISNIVFYLTAFTLNYIVISYKLKIKFPLKKLIPFISGSLLLILFILNLKLAFAPSTFLLIIEIIGGAALYLFAVVIFIDPKSLPIKKKKLV